MKKIFNLNFFFIIYEEIVEKETETSIELCLILGEDSIDYLK